MTRRALLLVAAAGALAGCVVEPPGGSPPAGSVPPPTSGPPVEGGPGWTLVVDGASVPDYGDGVEPAVYVTGLFDGYSAATPAEYGFDVALDAPLFDGDAGAYESDGVDLQVWADYGGGATLIGELVYTPTPDEFGVGPIDLGAFDDVIDLQVELQAD